MTGVQTCALPISGPERYRKVTRFVRAFFEQLHDLQAPPHHPKWRDIDVAASVPGWTRFAAAKQWITKAELGIHDSSRDARLLEGVAQREAAALKPQERNALFTEFVDYQKRHSHTLSSSALPDAQQRIAFFAASSN